MGNTTSPQTLQQGVSLFNDVTDFLGARTAGQSPANAEERARLIETDAEGEARDIRRRAEQDAARLREDQEHARAGNNAEWGGSGLAMSGSKALIRDADRLKGRQDEEDILFDGEKDARSRLRSANNRANMLRIGGDASPRRSILSLGSKIYGRD